MVSLNAEQENAISTTGDVLLQACPGSGKTLTLVYKIAEELKKVSSHREFVIALTYTNVAADEILERVEKLGVDTSQLWVGTIHSFCLTWILRPYSHLHPDLNGSFKIVDIYQSEQLMKELAEQRPGSLSHYDCQYFATPHGFVLRKDPGQQKLIAAQDTMKVYREALLSENKVDFEMILQFSYDLLLDRPLIAKRLAHLFRIIAVDEYQDTREIQYAIISLILKADKTKPDLFLVGDPNQQIFSSLGGVAKSINELQLLTGRTIKKLTLTNNYRSSQQVVDFFEKFSCQSIRINAVGNNQSYRGDIIHDTSITKSNLVPKISEIIKFNVEKLGIPPERICIVAPWRNHLVSITRALVQELPDYSFSGPGLCPFGENRDNFWYKVARIALTSSRPDMYRKRLRWAQDILDALVEFDETADLTPREFLKIANTVTIEQEIGSAYLQSYFTTLFELLKLNISPDTELSIQRDGFFDRMTSRIEYIRSQENVNIDTLQLFRSFFDPISGITISTIHGIKGREFDSVIAFGLLEGYVPHYTEPESSRDRVARTLMYVVASRARKNLYLISEIRRTRSQPSKIFSLTSISDYTSRTIHLAG